MNAVIAAVGIMLILSLSRVHVVIALIIGALVGGLVGGLGIEARSRRSTVAWAVAPRLPCPMRCWALLPWPLPSPAWPMPWLTRALAMIDRQGHANGGKVKWLMIGLMLVVAVSSQNILPIHIAFIPLLVPPLAVCADHACSIDRRLIACVITFGLITPYMFLPVGFGNIFLNRKPAGQRRPVPGSTSAGST